MEKEALIHLNQLSIGYKKSDKPIEILAGLNYSFYAGELVGIMGLNGMGKSTLLKSIAGLLPSLKGSIEVAGTKVGIEQVVELSKKVSIVLTERFGGFNLTTMDVVSSGLSPYTNLFNQLNANQHQLVNEAIKQCHLQDYQNHRIEELSDGFFQRTLIAKALAQQTPVMLLDEPSAFLDFASKHELFILLKHLAELQKKCILISSHDIEMLKKYCHKLLIISQNRSQLIEVQEANRNTEFLAITKGFL